MQRLFLFIFSFIIIQTHLSASEVGDLVQKYEAEVEAEIKKQGKTNEDKYYIYALFARELLGLKEYELSKNYYQKALSAGEEAEILDMSEVHYNMLFIRYKQGADKNELKKLFSIVKSTIQNQDAPKIKAGIKYWEIVINGDNKRIDESLLNSYIGAPYSMAKLQQLIENKEYKKALNLLPANIKDVNMVLKLHYDVLNRIVFTEKKNLLCGEKLKKYPRSPATSMQICRFLKGNEKVITIETIQKQMEREEFKYEYLLSALKEVKNEEVKK